MRSKLKVVQDDRRQKRIRVNLVATIALSWDGEDIELAVPEDATRKEIKDAIVTYLKSDEVSYYWDWDDPEIHEWEIIEDDEAE